jgi:hypothetical protein
VELYGQGKLIRPPELSGSLTSSNLVAKQEELAKELMNLCLAKYRFHTSKGLLTCRKISRLGTDDFTSTLKEVV